VEKLLQQECGSNLLDAPAWKRAQSLLGGASPIHVRGQQLGPYIIQAPIGSGGMGEVYLAHDPRLDRRVAIKLLPERLASDSVARQRFRREAQATAALDHPFICKIFEVGEYQGTLFLVMEYLRGETLSVHLRRGRLPLSEALRIAGEIAEALEEAHANHFIHRDLKPANIMLTGPGSGPTGRVKVMDFGLAKRMAPDEFDETITGDVEPLTEKGWIAGTPEYMSPEQAAAGLLDSRSDLFSFGIILCELLCGKHPFRRGSPRETMAAILCGPPALADTGDLQPGLVVVMQRLLAKAPGDRFQTVAEVRAAIERAARGEAAPKAESRKRPSLAVLPFANISSDKENEYFSDGLAEEILSLMSKVPGMRVIARTSSFAFRGKEQDISKIAEALRVENILEGSVRRSGNRIRVVAQLIQASDGSRLWSERYDRDLTDVFAIQDEIGEAIAAALEVRLASHTPVVNVEAWEHCLKGAHYRGRNVPGNLAKAQEHFQQALEIDPGCVRAYSGLAFCYYVLCAVGAKPVAEIKPLARAAAQKALAIDPSDSESHAILGAITGVFDYDWERAAKHHLLSIAAEQVPPIARYCYAIYCLLPKQRRIEAIEQMRLALQSDPLSILVHGGMVWSLCAGRRYQEALACGNRAVEIDPNHHLAWNSLGFAQLCAGLSHDAVATFTRVMELAPRFHMVPGFLAAAHAPAGDLERAGELAQQFPRGEGLDTGHAIYYAAANDAQRMFEALESSYQRRDIFLPIVNSFPFFAPYRTDPRYRDLLARMHLS
jgi:serine/threonine protein kinase/Tfp pilus assembly protein PilF